MFTELEFLEAMKQFPTIVEETAEYRFHYDDAGRITMCTARQHPENTQYVVVDHETYDTRFHSKRVSKGLPQGRCCLRSTLS
jgi:hypothetical protein